jgi:hypothetical protein
MMSKATICPRFMGIFPLVELPRSVPVVGWKFGREHLLAGGKENRELSGSSLAADFFHSFF